MSRKVPPKQNKRQPEAKHRDKLARSKSVVDRRMAEAEWLGTLGDKARKSIPPPELRGGLADGETRSLRKKEADRALEKHRNRARAPRGWSETEALLPARRRDGEAFSVKRYLKPVNPPPRRPLSEYELGTLSRLRLWLDVIAAEHAFQGVEETAIAKLAEAGRVFEVAGDQAWIAALRRECRWALQLAHGGAIRTTGREVLRRIRATDPRIAVPVQAKDIDAALARATLGRGGGRGGGKVNIETALEQLISKCRANSPR